MRIPKTRIQTTWRADWLAEFSTALVALTFLTREIFFGAVGVGVLLALAGLGLVFRRRLRILRREFHVAEHISKTRVFLGDSVDGELTIQNGSPVVAQILAVRPVADKALSFVITPSFGQLLQPGSASSSRFAIMPLARGRLEISGFTFAFTDPRGLFTGEVRYPQADWIEAYPGTRTPMPLTPLQLYGGTPALFRRGPAGIDYAGTREYAPGDEYQRVEWKATARLGTLMVKEFHPETRTTLQILIDAGRTMHQQSYVGTRLDEALAVAWLLTESVVGLENRVGIWIYNETQVVRAIPPATAAEQLVSLRELGLAIRPHAASNEIASGISSPRATRFGAPSLILGEQASALVRLLTLKLGSAYRKTGIYKALTQAKRMSSENHFIVLSDLQTNIDALFQAGASQQEQGRTLVMQIGAPWRLRSSLEEAYVEHLRNSQTLGRLRRYGLTVLDVRPEALTEAIAQSIGRTTGSVRSEEHGPVGVFDALKAGEST